MILMLLMRLLMVIPTQYSGHDVPDADDTDDIVTLLRCPGDALRHVHGSVVHHIAGGWRHHRLRRLLLHLSDGLPHRR